MGGITGPARKIRDPYRITPHLKGSCLECNTGYRGRTDKKFCSDYCRNAYHNRLNRDSNNLVRTVNNRLRKNYRILKRITDSPGEGPVRRTQLADLGFDFNTITRIKDAHPGGPCYCVYDLGYVPLGEDRFKIVKTS